MEHCETLLEHLDDALEGRLTQELSIHLAGCSQCQEVVARCRDQAEAGRVMRDIAAPPPLVQRLAGVPRLAPACEEAQELLRAALDGELEAEVQSRLVDHIHGCPSCMATWESFATLREVGANTRPSRHLVASLSLHPRYRLQSRRPRRVLNLRLATAAAYLVAAATIVLVGNPATIARASSSTLDRAELYARAAVENRLTAYSRKVSETVAVGEDWVREKAMDIWDSASSLLGRKPANPAPSNDVSPGGNGGNR